MGKRGPVSTDEQFSTATAKAGELRALLAKLDAKADDVRELTRGANETLKDLRNVQREINRSIDKVFAEGAAERFRVLDEEIGAYLLNFSNAMRRHSDLIQKALSRRWRYIETMCSASPTMSSLIALFMLQRHGGPVDTEGAKWHLVKETSDTEGPLFAFHRSLADRMEVDPAIGNAVQRAVNEYEPPSFDLHDLFMMEEEGSDEK